jgi:hypothetical protein
LDQQDSVLPPLWIPQQAALIQQVQRLAIRVRFHEDDEEDQRDGGQGDGQRRGDTLPV